MTNHMGNNREALTWVPRERPRHTQPGYCLHPAPGRYTAAPVHESPEGPQIAPTAPRKPSPRGLSEARQARREARARAILQAEETKRLREKISLLERTTPAAAATTTTVSPPPPEITRAATTAVPTPSCVTAEANTEGRADKPSDLAQPSAEAARKKRRTKHHSAAQSSQQADTTAAPLPEGVIAAGDPSTPAPTSAAPQTASAKKFPSQTASEPPQADPSPAKKVPMLALSTGSQTDWELVVVAADVPYLPETSDDDESPSLVLRGTELRWKRVEAPLKPVQSHAREEYFGYSDLRSSNGQYRHLPQYLSTQGVIELVSAPPSLLLPLCATAPPAPAVEYHEPHLDCYRYNESPAPFASDSISEDSDSPQLVRFLSESHNAEQQQPREPTVQEEPVSSQQETKVLSPARSEPDDVAPSPFHSNTVVFHSFGGGAFRKN